jgi:Fe-S cluster assembly ATPase SufC
MAQITLITGATGSGKSLLAQKLGGNAANTIEGKTITADMAPFIKEKLDKKDDNSELFITLQEPGLWASIDEHVNLKRFICLGVKNNGEVEFVDFDQLPF